MKLTNKSPCHPITPAIAYSLFCYLLLILIKTLSVTIVYENLMMNRFLSLYLPKMLL